MSDINIEFDWYVFPLLAVMFGWPGLLIGGVAGGYLWRRHRVIGTLLGAGQKGDRLVPAPRPVPPTAPAPPPASAPLSTR